MEKAVRKKSRLELGLVGDSKSLGAAALASSLPKVSVTVGEMLGEKMEMKVFEEIKGVVMDQILEISGVETPPRSKETVLRSGRVIFICEDEETAEWLRGVVPSVKLSGEDSVQLGQPKELIRMVKMTVAVPPPKKYTDKLVGIQNGIETGGRIVHNVRDLESGHTLLVLGVDLPSTRKLKERKFRVHLGTGEVVFRTASKNQCSLNKKD